MSAIDLEASLEKAQERLGSDKPRRPRSDRGEPRLDPAIRQEIQRLLLAQERPAVKAMQAELEAFCRQRGKKMPARSTLYLAMASFPAHAYRIEDLPPGPRRALYNLPTTGEVPGHQLAFYCLNYGDLEAISFAGGMPWLALYQAARMRGWRERSRGLLDAICRVRRI